MMYPTKVYRGYPWYLDELLTRPYNFKHQHVKQKTERERESAHATHNFSRNRKPSNQSSSFIMG